MKSTSKYLRIPPAVPVYPLKRISLLDEDGLNAANSQKALPGGPKKWVNLAACPIPSSARDRRPPSPYGGQIEILGFQERIIEFFELWRLADVLIGRGLNPSVAMMKLDDGPPSVTDRSYWGIKDFKDWMAWYKSELAFFMAKGDTVKRLIHDIPFFRDQGYIIAPVQLMKLISILTKGDDPPPGVEKATWQERLEEEEELIERYEQAVFSVEDNSWSDLEEGQDTVMIQPREEFQWKSDFPLPVCLKESIETDIPQMEATPSPSPSKESINGNEKTLVEEEIGEVVCIGDGGISTGEEGDSAMIVEMAEVGTDTSSEMAVDCTEANGQNNQDEVLTLTGEEFTEIDSRMEILQSSTQANGPSLPLFDFTNDNFSSDDFHETSHAVIDDQAQETAQPETEVLHDTAHKSFHHSLANANHNSESNRVLENVSSDEEEVLVEEQLVGEEERQAVVQVVGKLQVAEEEELVEKNLEKKSSLRRKSKSGHSRKNSSGTSKTSRADRALARSSKSIPHSPDPVNSPTLISSGLSRASQPSQSSGPSRAPPVLSTLCEEMNEEQLSHHLESLYFNQLEFTAKISANSMICDECHIAGCPGNKKCCLRIRLNDLLDDLSKAMEMGMARKAKSLQKQIKQYLEHQEIFEWNKKVMKAAEILQSLHNGNNEGMASTAH